MLVFGLLAMVIALVVIAAMIVAITFTVRDQTLPTLHKALWCAGIVLFPVCGVLVWGVVKLVTHLAPNPSANQRSA